MIEKILKLHKLHTRH